MLRKLGLITAFTLLFSGTLFSQETTRNLIVETISKECNLFFGEETKACGDKNFKKLTVQFSAAEIYLSNKIKSLQTISDSTTLFNKAKVELGILEQQGPKKKLKAERENAYLYLSILKPNASKPYFFKLIHSYFKIDSVQVKNEQSGAFIHYKAWLYRILHQHFKNESPSFEARVSSLYTNTVVKTLGLSFADIPQEIKRIEQLKSYATLATNIPNSFYTNEQLVHSIYEKRIEKIIEKQTLTPTKEQFDFIEGLFLEAIQMFPKKSSIKYNLGVFYYNESVALTMGINSDESKAEKSERKIRAKNLMNKSKTMMK